MSYDNTMKLIEFKIKRFKELVTGILISSGTHWSLVRLNVVDYVLDGFMLINKKYIVYEKEIEKSTILHKILSIKNKTGDMVPSLDKDILDEISMIYSYLEKSDLMIAVCLHREDVLYIGKIKDVGTKSFFLDSYDTELQKSGLMKIEFNKVRYIQIHTDYIDSLSLLMDTGQQ